MRRGTESVLTVDAAGKVKARRVGRAVITAAVYNEVSENVEIQVKHRKRNQSEESKKVKDDRVIFGNDPVVFDFL